jgi:hypothetical protein
MTTFTVPAARRQVANRTTATESPTSTLFNRLLQQNLPLSDIARCVPCALRPTTFGSSDGTGVWLRPLQTKEHEFKVFRHFNLLVDAEPFSTSCHAKPKTSRTI